MAVNDPMNEEWEEFLRELLGETEGGALPPRVAAAVNQRVAEDHLRDFLGHAPLARPQAGQLVRVAPRENLRQRHALPPQYHAAADGAIQPHGAYRRQYYALDGAAPTLADFFRAIRRETERLGVNREVAGVDIAYRLPGGQLTWRNIRHGTEQDMEVSALAKEQGFTAAAGSDPIAEGSEVEPSQFYINWWQPVDGAGSAHYRRRDTRYYECQEQTRRDEQCLIGVMRLAAPRAVRKWTKKIMAEHGYGENDPLPTTAMDWLEPLFGVSLPIWDGDAIEIERAFHDTKARGNTCVATAREVVLRPINPAYKRAENGLAIIHTTLPDGSGHYALAVERKEVNLHPVTGDEHTPGLPETREHIAARLMEQGRTIHGAALKRAAKPRFKKRVLCYDLETVADAASGELYAYAAAWFEFDPEQPPDFSQLEAQVTYKLNPRPADERQNPLLALLDYIAEAPDDVVYTIEAYNGAAFDHLFLSRAAASRDRFGDLNWYSGKVYAGKIYGRHRFHDLCRFTTTSLAKACDSFAASPKKVAGFEHAVPQRAFYEDRFPEWITANLATLEHYIRNDVLSLCSLLVKARGEFCKLTGRDILDYPTIGKLAWDTWSEGLAEPPVGPVTREIDQFMRRAMTAGRVQIMREGGRPQAHEGQFRMFDYKSLYPTVCLAKGFGDEAFPVGPCSETPCYVPGKLGIYECQVKSQPAIKVVPKRGERLDWTCGEEFAAVLTSVDIEEILSNGGAVEVGKGYYWPRSDKTLFNRYFEPIAAEKQRQDALKDADDPSYNPALREVCKLLMNCLTGKVAQRERLAKTKIVRGAKAQHAFRARHDDVEVTPLYGERIIMSGVPKNSRWDARRAKPCFIACFIYAYARRCLYDLLPWAYYCDTDSALVRAEDEPELRAQRPHRFPHVGQQPEFGHVDEELGTSSASHRVILLQPKTYMIAAVAEDGSYAMTRKGESLSKIRAKGVCRRDAILGRAEAERMLSRDQAVPEAEGAAASVANRFYTMERLLGEEERRFSDEANAEKLFREILQTGSGYVFCSQLVRSLGRVGADGAHKAFVLAQRYTVKKLSCSKDGQHGQEPQKEEGSDTPIEPEADER